MPRPMSVRTGRSLSIRETTSPSSDLRFTRRSLAERQLCIGIGNPPLASGLFYCHLYRWGESPAATSELLTQRLGHLTSVEFIDKLQPNAKQILLPYLRSAIPDRPA